MIGEGVRAKLQDGRIHSQNILVNILLLRNTHAKGPDGWMTKVAQQKNDLLSVLSLRILRCDWSAAWRKVFRYE